MLSKFLWRYVVALCASAFLAASIPTNSAEVRITDYNADGYVARIIVVEGEIEKGDFSKIDEAFDSSRVVARMRFFSTGGNVDEAMKIAELVNQKLVEVAGPIGDFNYCRQSVERYKRYKDKTLSPLDSRNCACYSSCAIVWLSAAWRSDSHGIGIHRARFDPEYFAGLTKIQAEEKYKVLLNEVTTFLLAHDVPLSIVNKMNATPSADMYILPDGDIELVGGKRPFFDELVRAKCSAFSEAESEANQLEAEARRLEKQVTKLMTDADQAARLDEFDKAHLLMSKADALQEKSSQLSLQSMNSP